MPAAAVCFVVMVEVEPRFCLSELCILGSTDGGSARLLSTCCSLVDLSVVVEVCLLAPDGKVQITASFGCEFVFSFWSFFSVSRFCKSSWSLSRCFALLLASLYWRTALLQVVLFDW